MQRRSVTRSANLVSMTATLASLMSLLALDCQIGKNVGLREEKRQPRLKDKKKSKNSTAQSQVKN